MGRGGNERRALRSDNTSAYESPQRCPTLSLLRKLYDTLFAEQLEIVTISELLQKSARLCPCERFRVTNPISDHPF